MGATFTSRLLIAVGVTFQKEARLGARTVGDSHQAAASGRQPLTDTEGGRDPTLREGGWGVLERSVKHSDSWKWIDHSNGNSALELGAGEIWTIKNHEFRQRSLKRKKRDPALACKGTNRPIPFHVLWLSSCLAHRMPMGRACRRRSGPTRGDEAGAGIPTGQDTTILKDTRRGTTWIGMGNPWCSFEFTPPPPPS